MTHAPFIVFEGIDGSGKTSLATALVDALEERGHRTFRFSQNTFAYDPAQPLDQRIEQLQQVIWPRTGDQEMPPLPPMCETQLVAGWFTLISQRFIESARAQGTVVLGDSWVYKRIVRLQQSPDINPDYVTDSFVSVSQPTLTFLLDIDPAVTWARRDFYPTKDLGLSLAQCPDDAYAHYTDFQSRIRAALRSMATTRGWSVLDATLPIADNVTHCLQAINTLLPTTDTGFIGEGE